MIKRTSLVFTVIVAFLFSTLNWVTPTLAAVSEVPSATVNARIRPQRYNPNIQSVNSIQSVTDGENVMWFDNPSITGVSLYMSVDGNVDLHNSAAPWNVELAHTMRPPNSACLEGFTTYGHDYLNVTQNYFAVVSWCGGDGGFVTKYQHAFDTTWVNKYAAANAFATWTPWNYPTRTATFTDATFQMAITKNTGAGNCWSAYLWNIAAGTWDTIATKCGTPDDPIPADGWTSFEQHYQTNTVCGGFGSTHVMESRYVKSQVGVGTLLNEMPAADISYTDLGATRCDPTPHTPHHVNESTWNYPYVRAYGYMVCVPSLQPKC